MTSWCMLLLRLTFLWQSLIANKLSQSFTLTKLYPVHIIATNQFTRYIHRTAVDEIFIKIHEYVYDLGTNCEQFIEFLVYYTLQFPLIRSFTWIRQNSKSIGPCGGHFLRIHWTLNKYVQIKKPIVYATIIEEKLASFFRWTFVWNWWIEKKNTEQQLMTKNNSL